MVVSPSTECDIPNQFSWESTEWLKSYGDRGKHTYYHDGQLTGNQCRKKYTHFSNAVFVILDTKFVMDTN